jgi:DNA-binding winged helix-turn-helix (wHTH) protein
MYQGAKYLFGPFELRTRTRELYKHGVKLKLRPQAYQVLALLLEHSGECVTREELQKRVWPSDTFVDFEN